MPGPLDGYRIVDLTAMITGPLATMLLADQGAEVVKVEPPGTGDVMRYLSSMRGGMSSFFASCNRSKRSVVVNLREERGREIVRGLVREADVFVQNFRPGVIDRLGLGEPELRRDRPDVVYVSLTAFGETGPFAARPAYDHILQAMTGATFIQGDPVTGRPEYMKMAWCDKITAYTAAQAITAALLARERGKGGQHIRLSMLDAALAFLWPDGYTNHTLLEEDGVVPMPHFSVTYRYVETTDGFVAIAAVTDAQWEGLFRAIDREDLLRDERFATMAARMANVDALVEELGDGKVDMTSDEAIGRLQAQDVPCGPLLRPDDIASFPQVVANETLFESEHPVLGRIRQARPAPRFGATPAAVSRPAPSLGEHTDSVLREIGIDESEIGKLRADGVVG